jgi:hypothetical protein
MKPHAVSLTGLFLMSAGACTPAPTVPANPTWADVAPVLRGECTHCHGSTAVTTGGGYRLDFFDMSPDVCGAAAQGLPNNTLLAGGSAALVKLDLTPTSNAPRPRMPPAPAPGLSDWERETVVRWTAQPSKGPPPQDNEPPSIEVGMLPATVNGRLQFTAVTTDPDGDPVVGVIQIANTTFAMDRSGAFSVDLDSSAWAAGTQRLTAVLCDGWTKQTYDLGPVRVQH